MPPGNGLPPPRVSVVVPVYDQAPYLRRAINSVLRQTRRHLELILIDDGSTDGSGAIMDEYAAWDSRVRVVRQPNSGTSAAINRGVSMARSAYIGRLDGDDIAVPDRFERQARFLDEHPDIGIVGGHMMRIDPHDKPMRPWRFPIDPAVLHQTVLRETVIGGPAPLIRRSVIDAVGGWRSQFDYTEDFDFCLRISEKTKMTNLDDFVTLYRIHDRRTSTVHAARQAGLVIVARACAYRRRAGLPEPISRYMPIDGSVVDRLGLPPEEAAKLREMLSPSAGAAVRAIAS